MMWHGSIEDIPDGWFLCNGQTVTDKYGHSKAVPDLRQRFIIGQDESTSIGDTGGVDNAETHEEEGDHTHIGGDHTHYVSGDSHAHGLTLNNSSATDTHSDSTKPGDSTVDVYDDGCGAQCREASNHGASETHEAGWDYLYQPNSHQHKVNSSHGHTGSITTDQGASGTLIGNGNHHLQSNTTAGTHTHEGGEHVHTWDNQPPYYILAFIIKLN